jgi:8-oxo-dGTP diphosphatase
MSVTGRPDPLLQVVAAAIIVERRLLVVSKRAAPAVFYLPGGKPEPGEPPLACLRREIDEELGDVPLGLAPAVRDHVLPALRAEGMIRTDDVSCARRRRA